MKAHKANVTQPSDLDGVPTSLAAGPNIPERLSLTKGHGKKLRKVRKALMSSFAALEEYYSTVNGEQEPDKTYWKRTISKLESASLRYAHMHNSASTLNTCLERTMGTPSQDELRAVEDMIKWNTVDVQMLVDRIRRLLSQIPDRNPCKKRLAELLDTFRHCDRQKAEFEKICNAPAWKQASPPLGIFIITTKDCFH